MKKKALFGSLTILVLIGMAVLTATYLAGATGPDVCGRGSFLNQHACSELEQQILSATVRITLESWVLAEEGKGYETKSSTGHATVMNGRYLVTHNHFSLPLNSADAADSGASVMVSLYDSGGELLFRGPLSAFDVVSVQEQTVVLAHKEEGFFEALGFRSATFQAATALPLEPGMTVAQIDWDGQQTRVDWVTIERVILDEGTPRLVLFDGATAGASGGGIFWQGVHVANNWGVGEYLGPAGEVIEAVTIAALNSAAVAGL
ncbi:MAG: hypothetical protein R3300_18445 [Candidatus Promineifilaceae bacterium]|nr:hypothetical protein [Candidatus Promineifilaceae bacterium]